MTIWDNNVPRHWFDSYCASVDDDPAAQKFPNMALVGSVIAELDNIHFNVDRKRPEAWGFDIRFGEHYRFFAALTKVLKPCSIVEIGTSTGASARSFLDFSPDTSKVHTFDVIPWNKFDFAGGTWLTENDFSSGKLVQYLDDLSIEQNFEKHADLLCNADLIFCDAPKDGVFEYRLMDKISKLKMPFKTRYLILDDIRFLNMAALWRKIASPKIDLTSFGHWSGTGLVDISSGVLLK
jgi:hypothetical protein